MSWFWWSARKVPEPLGEMAREGPRRFSKRRYVDRRIHFKNSAENRVIDVNRGTQWKGAEIQEGVHLDCRAIIGIAYYAFDGEVIRFAQVSSDSLGFRWRERVGRPAMRAWRRARMRRASLLKGSVRLLYPGSPGRD